MGPILRQHSRSLVAAAICASVVVASGCTSSVVPQRTVSTKARTSVPDGSPVAPRNHGFRIVSSMARWRLRTPLSRASAFSSHGRIVLAGGLTAGTSTASVLAIDPVSGVPRRIGTLPLAVHDAAGGTIRGALFLFGGGSSTSTSVVQRVGSRHAVVAGQLPTARSDVAAAQVDRAVYLIGGYDGLHWTATVLRTQDGRTFTPVAHLAVPVRYAAVAAEGGDLWVFGGLTPSGATAAVQRVDPTTGRTKIVAHLPMRLLGASALVVHGAVLVCGGNDGQHSLRTIYRFDPTSTALKRVGTLPQPDAFAAAAVVGGAGYLLGGENPNLPTRRVQVIRAAP
jgi:Kelch motif protein